MVMKSTRNSLALNIDKAIDIFFNFDAKIKKKRYCHYEYSIGGCWFFCFYWYIILFK